MVCIILEQRNLLKWLSKLSLPRDRLQSAPLPRAVRKFVNFYLCTIRREEARLDQLLGLDPKSFNMTSGSSAPQKLANKSGDCVKKTMQRHQHGLDCSPCLMQCKLGLVCLSLCLALSLFESLSIPLPRALEDLDKAWRKQSWYKKTWGV